MISLSFFAAGAIRRETRVFEKTPRWSLDNYFYHGYCTGQFDQFPKCPRYMAQEHYESLVASGADTCKQKKDSGFSGRLGATTRSSLSCGCCFSEHKPYRSRV